MNSKDFLQIVEEIRTEVSCCCSEHRYTEINRLCDELEYKLQENTDDS